MLEDVCHYIHNYFELDRYEETFEIVDGMLQLPFLLEGQRFRVLGSALNDGIYTYHADGIKNDDDAEAVELEPETFDGTILCMGVPKTVLKIVDDINAWQDKNKAALDSPYMSESFGGYSYTKAYGSGANAGKQISWQDVFGARLNAYRKLAWEG